MDGEISKIKRKLLLVKVKDASPKKTHLIRRRLQDGDNLDASSFEIVEYGNKSPKKPILDEGGSLVSRSILGKPEDFLRAEKLLVAGDSPQSRAMSRRLSSRRGMSFRSEAVTIESVTNGNDIDGDLPSRYLKRLLEQAERAKNVRIQEKHQEEHLMSFLPANEKFSMNKEGKVLARWMERQRDWDDIEASISKRVNAPQSHKLMMGKTDEFRMKMEQYDLIQLAIPAAEKFNSSAWVKSLRNGGTRIVSVGHLFSGLDCEIEKPVVKAPPLIRKPHALIDSSMMDLAKGTSIIDSLDHKLQRLVQTHRPSHISTEDASSLFFRSLDLFEWAYDSAASHFMENADNNEINKASNYYDELSGRPGISAEEEVNERRNEAKCRAGGLQLNESEELVFLTAGSRDAANTVERSVNFTNKCSFVVEYFFRALGAEIFTEAIASKEAGNVIAAPASDVFRAVHQHHQKIFALNSAAEGRAVDATRDALSILRLSGLANVKPKFLCLKQSGRILPGETVEIKFSFCSKGIAGAVSQTWEMLTTPQVPFFSGPQLNTNGPIPFMRLNLHGHFSEIDEHRVRRGVIKTQLEYLSITTFMRDIVSLCVRRVRQPVRRKDIIDRCRRKFMQINGALLAAESPAFGADLPILITPDHLSYAATLCDDVLALEIDLLNQLQRIRGRDEAIDDRLSLAALRNHDPLLLAALEDEIFPEKDVEIFDEITSDVYKPTWDLDLTGLRLGAQSCLAIAQQLRDAEVAVEKIAKEEARIARKQREKDEDEDDDAEDKEEEQEGNTEDEADVITIEKFHPAIALARKKLAQCNGFTKLLTIFPVMPAKRAEIADTFSKILSEGLESLPEWASKHRAAVGLQDASVIAQAPLGVVVPGSPYVSSEHASAWKNILIEAAMPADAKSGGKAPKKPESKAVKKISDVVTQDTVDSYYKAMHATIRGELLLIVEKAFVAVEASHEKMSTAHFKSRGRLGQSFIETAALRKEDAAGKMAFLTFDGSLFVDRGGVAHSQFFVQPKSAYSSVLPALQERALAAAHIVAHSGCRCIVLLSESKPATAGVGGDPPSLLEAAAARILSTLNKLRDAFKTTKEGRKTNICYTLEPCPTLPDLQHRVSEFLRTSDMHRNRGSNGYVTVFLLEDLAFKSIAPPEPTLPVLVCGDEDVPLDIGEPEYEAQRAARWTAKRPHRVKCTVIVRPPPPPLTTNAAVREDVKSESSVEILCYADAVAGLNEVIEMAQQGAGGVVWVDCSQSVLYLPLSSVLQRVSVRNKTASGSNSPSFLKLVSSEVRQMLMWSSVLYNIPASKQLLVEAASVENPTTIKNELSGLFSRLFPRCTILDKTTGTKEIFNPKLCVVIGGFMSKDKIRFMDEIIELASSIILAGEFALPFLALSSRIELLFPAYVNLCSDYSSSCAALMHRARLRGVRIILPVDLLMGDLPVTVELKEKAYLEYDPDSRGDGVDYDGEAQSVFVGDIPPAPEVISLGPIAGSTDFDTKVVQITRGVYDIGKESCKALVNEIATSDLLLVWGLVGACEVSTFQTGQRALVEASIIAPPKNTLEITASQPNKGSAADSGPPVAAFSAVDVKKAASAPSKVPAGKEQTKANGKGGDVKKAGGSGGAGGAPHLAEATTTVSSSSIPTEPLRGLSHTCVIGDSSVEWYTRIVDPDGELGGDLVSAGRLSFACRNSIAVTGVFGLVPSPALESISKRLATEEQEWVMSDLKLSEEEEEEEDD